MADFSNKDANGGNANDFQHRHFAFVARVISKLDDKTRAQVAHLFVDYFTANPRFQRSRFEAACKVDRATVDFPKR